MTIRVKTKSRKASELDALRKIAVAVNSQIDDLDQLMSLILTHASGLAGAKHGALMLYQQETESLHIVASVGEDWTPEKRAHTTPIGQGTTGKVFAAKEPYLCPDTKADSNYFALFDSVLSELAVPVVSQGRAMGVIIVDSDRQDAFSQADQDWLFLMAEFAAIAIENARQFNYNKATRERWTQIFDAMPDAMVIGDEDFNVERANEKYYDFFKVSPDQVLGHGLFQVFGLIAGFGTSPGWEDRLRQGEKIDEVFREMATQKQYRWRAQRVHPGGKPIYLCSFEERDCNC
jgi:putative methionine-R-sulfoxide reductase with GAF domain